MGGEVGVWVGGEVGDWRGGEVGGWGGIVQGVRINWVNHSSSVKLLGLRKMQVISS